MELGPERPEAPRRGPEANRTDQHEGYIWMFCCKAESVCHFQRWEKYTVVRRDGRRTRQFKVNSFICAFFCFINIYGAPTMCYLLC